MIKASERDYIIEPYFDGGDSYIGHKKYSYISQYSTKGAISVSQEWDSAGVKILRNSYGSLYRNILECDISVYDTVNLKMMCASDVHISLYFDENMVLDIWGTGELAMYEAPINQQRVREIRYEMYNNSSEDIVVSLYYLGVSVRGISEYPMYIGEWEGCIERKISFEPYNDDYFTREKADYIAENANYDTRKKIAVEAMGVAPEQYISKMISTSYRGKMNFVEEIQALSFVGMVEKNSDMIRMACRYALSLASCTYWGCDIMEEIPACVWHHRSFNESCACEAIAYVISICGNSFTWHGRNILYQALIMKGLPRIEADLMTMDYIYNTNQGVAFISGYIKALIILSRQYPRYKKRIEEAKTLFFEMISKSIHKDGSTSEGAGYWQYTLVNILSCLSALAKWNGKSLDKYASETLLKTSDFGLFMIDQSSKTLPINDCGRGYYIPYMCKLFYMLTSDERWAYAYHTSDVKLLEIEDILLDIDVPNVKPVMHKEFEAYDGAGLVSVCRDGVRLICISGDSNSTHCHADKGSFVLYLDKGPVLCDRGVLPYNKTAVHDIKASSLHNTATPYIYGQTLEQKKGDGLTAKYNYEYKNGAFTWSSDQTALWDGDVVNSNVRTIYSSKANVFKITDRFTFVEPTAICVSFQIEKKEHLLIEALSEYEEMKCFDVDGITVMQYITKENKEIEFSTQITIRKID